MRHRKKNEHTFDCDVLFLLPSLIYTLHILSLMFLAFRAPFNSVFATNMSVSLLSLIFFFAYQFKLYVNIIFSRL